MVSDYAAVLVMGVAAIVAAGSFSFILQYLFAKGLADRNALVPNLMVIYRIYITNTKRDTGHIGGAFWAHCVFAGIFVATGVVYTLSRFILPRML
jgi:hypothetical protein